MVLCIGGSRGESNGGFEHDVNLNLPVSSELNKKEEKQVKPGVGRKTNDYQQVSILQRKPEAVYSGI